MSEIASNRNVRLPWGSQQQKEPHIDRHDIPSFSEMERLKVILRTEQVDLSVSAAAKSSSH